MLQVGPVVRVSPSAHGHDLATYDGRIHSHLHRARPPVDGNSNQRKPTRGKPSKSSVVLVMTIIFLSYQPV